MDTVYILQVVTICITALTLGINVMVTLLTNKQKNYNKVITQSRIDFMLRNRDNAAKFIAEAKNIVLMLKSGKRQIDIKPLYIYFEQLSISLKIYNTIDKEIIAVGNKIINSIEKTILSGSQEEELLTDIEKFSHLINIYDDADWKFIKQQFNSTTKNSEDFDKICNDIKSKYND